MATMLERGIRWWHDITPAVADIVLAVVVTALSLGGLFGPADQPIRPVAWQEIVLTLLATLPVALRRRHALAVLALVEAAEALYLATGPMNSNVSGFGVAAALYTLAVCTDRRYSLRIAGLVALVNALVVCNGLFFGRTDTAGSLVVVTLLVVGSWSLGENARTRRAYLAQLVDRARRLELEQEEGAWRAVQEERARIARELHDVVAHHVSAIAVQAGAAEEIAERDPRRTREALQLIRQSSRQALAEMRAMLNVLRSGDDIGPERGPQPSLAQVEYLVGQSRAAGLVVNLQVEGAVRPIPEALDVSSYRIVQEALTNCLKHAGPSHVLVLVRYGLEMLELEAARHNGASEGRGLIGMRERVARFGGELVVGAAPGAGFRVQARLPLGPP